MCGSAIRNGIIDRHRHVTQRHRKPKNAQHKHPMLTLLDRIDRYVLHTSFKVGHYTPLIDAASRTASRGPSLLRRRELEEAAKGSRYER